MKGSLMFNPISLLSRRQNAPDRPETPGETIGAAIYFRRDLLPLAGTITGWEVVTGGWNPGIRFLVSAPALKCGPVWVHEEDFLCYVWEREVAA